MQRAAAHRIGLALGLISDLLAERRLLLLKLRRLLLQPLDAVVDLQT